MTVIENLPARVTAPTTMPTLANEAPLPDVRPDMSGPVVLDAVEVPTYRLVNPWRPYVWGAAGVLIATAATILPAIRFEPEYIDECAKAFLAALVLFMAVKSGFDWYERRASSKSNFKEIPKS